MDKIIDIIDTIFSSIIKAYVKLSIWLINKYALLRKRFLLREEKKLIRKMGGQMQIKSNEYLGGTNVEISLPIKRKKKEK